MILQYIQHERAQVKVKCIHLFNQTPFDAAKNMITRRKKYIYRHSSEQRYGCMRFLNNIFLRIKHPSLYSELDCKNRGKTNTLVTVLTPMFTEAMSSEWKSLKLGLNNELLTSGTMRLLSKDKLARCN